MWLKTQGGKLVNLDTVEKIFIAGRKVFRSEDYDYLWPTVYAQLGDANREVDAVLFKSEFDPAGTGSGNQGREECQLYIDTLFGLITRRKSMQAIGHKEIAYLMEEQIKAGKHPNLSTPEEKKADAA